MQGPLSASNNAMPLLDQLHDLAKSKHRETAAFLERIKKRPPKNLDEKVSEIHEEVFEQTHCLECGNCCRTTGPMLFQKDIEILSRHFKIKPSQFIERHLKIDEDGDFVFKEMPCPFLGDDNYCSVYAYRPKACREYPHTNRKKIYQINHLTLKNVAICPAAFDIIEKLKQSGL